MANVKDVKTKGIAIELGGETRYLKFDLNAFAELEDMYGNIEEAMQGLEKGSIKALRAILWSGLLHTNPDITPQEVGSWIEIKDLPSLSGTLGQALESALPTEEAAQDGAGPFEEKSPKK